MIAIPFSKRLTASVAVFACLFIASPQGAQTFAFGNGVIIGALQLDYAQLHKVYHILRHQDVSEQQTVLYAAIAEAETTVASLNATIDSLMETGDAGFVLRGMQIVTANALASLKAVQSDEV